MLGAGGAGATDPEVGFAHVVAFGEFDLGFVFEAFDFVAAFALEVDVFMVVGATFAGVAEGVECDTAVGDGAVCKAFAAEAVEDAIDGASVWGGFEGACELLFYHFLAHKAFLAFHDFED